MGTAIFMVLMVCGYWYTSRDLSTRFKIKRSFGWDVYFLVALYGCIFVLQGVIATGLLWLLLLTLSAANNAFHFAGIDMCRCRVKTPEVKAENTASLKQAKKMIPKRQRAQATQGE